MNPNQLSGLVLTRGGEQAFATVNQLGALCAQVVVVHDTSRKSSEELSASIVHHPSVTVIERDIDHFWRQRNAGIAQAEGEWVLSIDDDELVSAELTREISTLDPNSGVSVYNIPRTDFLQKRPLSRGYLHSRYHPRLFQSYHRYKPHPSVHCEFAGFDYTTMFNLSGHIHHFPQSNLSGLVIKSFRYGRVSQANSDKVDYRWRTVIASAPRAIVQERFAQDGLRGIVAATANTAFLLGAKLPGKPHADSAPPKAPESELPRFLVAVDRYEQYLERLADERPTDQDTMQLFHEVLLACRGLSLAAQNFDFTTTTPTLIGTSAVTVSAERLVRELSCPDVPAEVRDIYQELYGQDLLPYAVSDGM